GPKRPHRSREGEVLSLDSESLMRVMCLSYLKLLRSIEQLPANGPKKPTVAHGILIQADRLEHGRTPYVAAYRGNLCARKTARRLGCQRGPWPRAFCARVTPDPGRSLLNGFLLAIRWDRGCIQANEPVGPRSLECLRVRGRQTYPKGLIQRAGRLHRAIS